MLYLLTLHKIKIQVDVPLIHICNKVQENLHSLCSGACFPVCHVRNRWFTSDAILY